MSRVRKFSVVASHHQKPTSLHCQTSIIIYLAFLTADTSTVGHKCECPDPLGLFVLEVGFVWLLLYRDVAHTALKQVILL